MRCRESLAISTISGNSPALRQSAICRSQVLCFTAAASSRFQRRVQRDRARCDARRMSTTIPAAHVLAMDRRAPRSAKAARRCVCCNSGAIIMACAATSAPSLCVKFAHVFKRVGSCYFPAIRPRRDKSAACISMIRLCAAFLSTKIAVNPRNQTNSPNDNCRLLRPECYRILDSVVTAFVTVAGEISSRSGLRTCVVNISSSAIWLLRYKPAARQYRYHWNNSTSNCKLRPLPHVRLGPDPARSIPEDAFTMESAAVSAAFSGSLAATASSRSTGSAAPGDAQRRSQLCYAPWAHSSPHRGRQCLVTIRHCPADEPGDYLPATTDHLSSPSLEGIGTWKQNVGISGEALFHEEYIIGSKAEL